MLGLLRSDRLHHIDKVLKFYWRRLNHSRVSQAWEFREQHCNRVAIQFVGLWDTVIRHGPMLAPVGWLMKYMLNRRFGLSDGQPGYHIHYIAHALALDETRLAFRPWRFDSPEGISPRLDYIEEMWFTGSHSDVGGGYGDGRLAEFSLRWIVERAAHAGLLFNEIPTISEASCKAQINESRIGMWRFLPSHRRVLRDSDRIHESVKLRMQATDYRPRAKLPWALPLLSA